DRVRSGTCESWSRMAALSTRDRKCRRHLPSEPVSELLMEDLHPQCFPGTVSTRWRRSPSSPGARSAAAGQRCGDGLGERALRPCRGAAEAYRHPGGLYAVLPPTATACRPGARDRTEMRLSLWYVPLERSPPEPR